MDMILGNVKFPNSFLPYFSTYVVGTYWNCLVPTTYVFSINEFFTISFF